MKIAQVVPLMNPVPPEKYGGIERVVETLTLGLAQKGYQISVFAAGGSTLTAKNVKLIACSPFPTIQDLSQTRRWELDQCLKVLSLQYEFDLIHLHYEPIIQRCKIDGIEFNLLNFLKEPILVTFHNTTYIKEHIDYYRNNKSLWRHNYVFISESQKRPLEFLPKSKVIYNGIDVEKFTFSNIAGDYLIFLGRIIKNKGILEAIQIAKLAKKKLIIAAKVDPTDEEFYQQEVKPLIDNGQIVYAGEVNFVQKNKYLSEALCSLSPIVWEEPFGLTMIEAMACGTPVVAFNRGSAPEIIKDGINGYLVSTVSEAASAIEKVSDLDRSKCREYVKKYFSAQRMIGFYEEYYKQILNNS